MLYPKWIQHFYTGSFFHCTGKRGCRGKKPLVLYKVMVADDFAADVKITNFACGKMSAVCTGSFLVTAGVCRAGLWRVLAAVFCYLYISFTCWFHKNRSFQTDWQPLAVSYF